MTISLFEASAENPPFDPDALVLEEDTGLVLSSEPTIRDSGVSQFRALMDLYQMQEHEVGGIVIRNKAPLQLLAIVHDLDREPSCDEKGVAMALAAALDLCEHRRLSQVAIQPLGCVHGKLEYSWFSLLLQEELAHRSGRGLTKVWLLSDRTGGLKQ